MHCCAVDNIGLVYSTRLGLQSLLLERYLAIALTTNLGAHKTYIIHCDKYETKSM